MNHAIVTTDNIDAVRPHVTAIDQRDELKPGCETWAITGGWMTVWPMEGRGAVMWGADSQWGEWDPNVRTLHLDDSDHVVDEAGEHVPADPDCE